MSSLVDFQNKDVKAYIKKARELPETDYFSPYCSIPRDQFAHYLWAKAYEDLEPIVSDYIYDLHAKHLKRSQEMFPDIWDEVSLQCFKDGSWEYTGMFIFNHDPEDEEWLYDGEINYD